MDSSFIQSPRLRQLEKTLADGDDETLDAFWEEVAEKGTPLIETVSGEDHLSLVTFLWRSNQAESVDMVSMMTRPSDQGMDRLPGTDIWYKSVKLGDDIRATYQFSPLDPQTPKAKGEGRTAGWANWRPDPFNSRHVFYNILADSRAAKVAFRGQGGNNTTGHVMGNLRDLVNISGHIQLSAIGQDRIRIIGTGGGLGAHGGTGD